MYLTVPFDEPSRLTGESIAPGDFVTRLQAGKPFSSWPAISGQILVRVAIRDRAHSSPPSRFQFSLISLSLSLSLSRGDPSGWPSSEIAEAFRSQNSHLLSIFFPSISLFISFSLICSSKDLASDFPEMRCVDQSWNFEKFGSRKLVAMNS